MTHYRRCTSTAAALGGTLLATMVVLLASPVTARAQVAWDTPRMVGPESPAGFGVYYLRSSALGPKMDAALVTLGLPGTGGSVAVRGGVAADDEDDLSVFGGVDIRASVARHTEDQPLDLEWTAGIGAGVPTTGTRYAVLSLPTAISAGRSWSSGSVWLAPYVSLGVAFDLNVGADAPDEEFEWSPTADIGLDLALDAARRFVVRVGASLGDRHAVAVGLDVH
jgi:hypothetical protein